MTHQMTEACKKWYGKFGYDNEGVVDYIETESKEIAEAYVAGINRAIEEIEDGGDDNPLEGYWTAVDQIEPVDEDELKARGK